MANLNDSLEQLMGVDGALGTCIVDYKSGMVLGKAGGGVDLDLAGAGNAEVVKAKMKTMKDLGIKGEIEDILITLENQFHVIRPASQHGSLFVYLVLDKDKSNLALARRKVESIESALEV